MRADDVLAATVPEDAAQSSAAVIQLTVSRDGEVFVFHDGSAVGRKSGGLLELVTETSPGTWVGTSASYTVHD